MKKLSTLGMIIGASLLWATPVSLHWSPTKALQLSVDGARAQIGRDRPYLPMPATVVRTMPTLATVVRTTAMADTIVRTMPMPATVVRTTAMADTDTDDMVITEL